MNFDSHLEATPVCLVLAAVVLAACGENPADVTDDGLESLSVEMTFVTQPSQIAVTGGLSFVAIDAGLLHSCAIADPN
jgi:hypothetical protein